MDFIPTEELLNKYNAFLQKTFGTANLPDFQMDFEKYVQEYQNWLKNFTYYGTEQWKKGQEFLSKLVELMFSHLPRK
jgi:hypothetical protein